MIDRLEPGEIPNAVLHSLADGACRTMDELHGMLDLSRRQISDGAAKLVLRDYLERVEAGCYQLTPAGITAAQSGTKISSGPWRGDTARVRKPVRNTFRRRLWNVMRMGGVFTIADLVMAAAREEDARPENNAARYVSYLVRAGYVEEQRTRKRGTKLTSSGFKRYRLVRNTGPLAPAYSPKRKVLHDYNKREDVPCGKKA
jgi:hypothetical protein